MTTFTKLKVRLKKIMAQITGLYQWKMRAIYLRPRQLLKGRTMM
uniref:Uncharacterized protein n=1 Tax=Romanomermis culicivorax TaxID=13658 RepID=A0A915JGY1_ROMCU